MRANLKRTPARRLQQLQQSLDGAGNGLGATPVVDRGEETSNSVGRALSERMGVHSQQIDSRAV